MAVIQENASKEGGAREQDRLPRREHGIEGGIGDVADHLVWLGLTAAACAHRSAGSFVT